jgi:hypothetical protein
MNFYAVQAWARSPEENFAGTTPMKAANPFFKGHLLKAAYKKAHFSGRTNPNQRGARTIMVSMSSCPIAPPWSGKAGRGADVIPRIADIKNRAIRLRLLIGDRATSHFIRLRILLGSSVNWESCSRVRFCFCLSCRILCPRLLIRSSSFFLGS